jgi:hypothetical protein
MNVLFNFFKIEPNVNVSAINICSTLYGILIFKIMRMSENENQREEKENVRENVSVLYLHYRWFPN